MKKLVRRFETIPLAEVLKKAVVVSGDGKVEKTGKKDEPYSVVSTRALGERR